MKFVKNYENVQQKTITLFDKLFIIDDFNNIIRFFTVINQKKKFERSSKLSTTIFKSLIIIVDSSIVVVSFSIFSNITSTFSNITRISTKILILISIIVFASNLKFTTNIFLLVSTKQKLIVMIFFKQISIDLKFSTMNRKSFVLK